MFFVVWCGAAGECRVSGSQVHSRLAAMGGTVERVFSALDVDNDGHLDAKEMRRALNMLG